MTSTSIKHQARLREWSKVIQECRNSGQSVRQWCAEQGITTATYYRWERELLSISSAASEIPSASSVLFSELSPPPQAEQPCQKVSEPFATVYIGQGCLAFHQELSSVLLKTLIEALGHAE